MDPGVRQLNFGGPAAPRLHVAVSRWARPEDAGAGCRNAEGGLEDAGGVGCRLPLPWGEGKPTTQPLTSARLQGRVPGEAVWASYEDPGRDRPKSRGSQKNGDTPPPGH